MVPRPAAAEGAAEGVLADQDGQLAEEGEEHAQPRMLKAPQEPSLREIEEHEAMGHAICRN